MRNKAIKTGYSHARQGTESAIEGVRYLLVLATLIMLAWIGYHMVTTLVSKPLIEFDFTSDKILEVK